MFIETACIFDSDDRTNRIRRLKQLMKDHGLRNLATNFEDDLRPYASLVSNIITIRSKVVAHKEASADPAELYKKHGIKPDDIKALLDFAAQLLLN